MSLFLLSSCIKFLNRRILTAADSIELLVGNYKEKSRLGMTELDYPLARSDENSLNLPITVLYIAPTQTGLPNNNFF